MLLIRRCGIDKMERVGSQHLRPLKDLALSESTRKQSRAAEGERTWAGYEGEADRRGETGSVFISLPEFERVEGAYVTLTESPNTMPPTGSSSSSVREV